MGVAIAVTQSVWASMVPRSTRVSAISVFSLWISLSGLLGRQPTEVVMQGIYMCGVVEIRVFGMREKAGVGVTWVGRVIGLGYVFGSRMKSS